MALESYRIEAKRSLGKELPECETALKASCRCWQGKTRRLGFRAPTRTEPGKVMKSPFLPQYRLSRRIRHSMRISWQTSDVHEAA